MLRRALTIAFISMKLRGRPYELVAVAGGWRHQGANNDPSCERHRRCEQAAEPGRAQRADGGGVFSFSADDGGWGNIWEVSRDLIANLRAAALIAAGSRSPQPGPGCRAINAVVLEISARHSHDWAHILTPSTLMNRRYFHG
jgi:hypothetical protein